MKKISLFLFIAFTLIGQINAQVDSLIMNFDLRTRFELNNGNHELLPEGSTPQAIVNTRSRIGLDYYYNKLQIYFSAQDVRAWGQTSTSSAQNQNFIINEAWARYYFMPKFSIKLGRQELTYDNERLVGRVDWSMQGRHFDAIKLSYTPTSNSLIDFVATYNTNNEVNDSTHKAIYSIAESSEVTKSMQLLYYKNKWNNGLATSVIVMNNVLQNPSGKYYDMTTIGLNIRKPFKRFSVYGSAYLQTGNNTKGQDKMAYQLSINTDFEASNKLHLNAGLEILSGNSYNTKSYKNMVFSPLYGSLHPFNGYMSYFYTNNYYNTFGLNDYYVKANLRVSKPTSFTGSVHIFTSNGKLGFDVQNNKMDSYLGTEIDLELNQNVGKYIQLSAGHSFMFASNSMKFILNINNAKPLQTWTWLSIKVNPQIRLK